jgi:hypothetical protein
LLTKTEQFSKMAIKSSAKRDRTNFLALPNELRQAILIDSYDYMKIRLIVPYGVDDSYMERRLKCVGWWASRLKEVDSMIADDIDYVSAKWEDKSWSDWVIRVVHRRHESPPS